MGKKKDEEEKPITYHHPLFFPFIFFSGLVQPSRGLHLNPKARKKPSAAGKKSSQPGAPDPVPSRHALHHRGYPLTRPISLVISVALC